MTITVHRWQQIKTILEEALEQTPVLCRSWARNACGDDVELWGKVESLLEYEAELDSFIEEPVLAAVSRAFEERECLDVGERVGPYRLLRLLGKGGMGSVYLAAREEGFEQRVALKLINPGVASEDTIRRFESERQILARLEHPNIARLLDGGKTAEGLPYFAMEVVEGIPIDRYCEEHELDVPARLRLFLGICSALQLAHQSLVIHRDLKPSNILVSSDGVPKLLDFGIAKILQPGGAADFSTQTAQQAFTLHYGSPEQLKGEPAGTRSDIYSLGVVLYQVLTGVLPGQLDDRSYFEVLKSICEVEPSLASEVAPMPRRRQLVGDVDAIVAKALRKELAARYASVENLADDLRSHLENRPVLARQGNVVYLIGKYVRRHRFGLIAAAAMLALAVGFTWLLMNEREETKKAQKWVEGLFQAADPNLPESAPELIMSRLLEKEREILEAGLELDPSTRATRSLKLGAVYFQRGDFSTAEALLEETISIHRRRESDDASELATALNNLASVYIQLGDGVRAEVPLRECIALRRNLGLEEPLFKSLGNLASILLARGEAREAERIYRETLARRRSLHGQSNENVAVNLSGLASALIDQGRLQETELLLLEVLSIREGIYGKKHTKVALILTKLGELYHAMKCSVEAGDLLRRAVDIQMAEKGGRHLDTARAKKALAQVYLDLADPKSGCPLLKESVVTLRWFRSSTDDEVVEAEMLLESSCAPAASPS